MNTKEQNQFRIRILISGLVILTFYGLGVVFPEPFWATNNPGLLPGWMAIALFVVAGLLFSSPFWWKESSKEGKSMGASRRNLLFLLLSVVIAFLYSQFPIYRDLYGDSYFIRQAVDIEIPKWDNRLLSEFFEPDWLDTKVGLKTWYQVNNFFTWLTGMNGVEIARIIGFVMGGIWAFLWMKFVDLHLNRAAWKWLFIAVGLTAPFTLVFMGHYETYSFSYTGILIWISALGIYFKTGSKVWLRALPVIFLLVLQTHITNWLLFPTLGMAFIWHFRERKTPALLKRLDAVIRKRFPRYQGGLTWSGLLVYYFIPAMLLGAYAYFFIFANHDGPRKFTEDEFESTLFLPLYTNEPAPYDRYNLFSPVHFSDYLNLMFMWSGAVLLLLVPPLTFLRKKVPWNDPLILITGSTALLMSLVFFVLNPLLTAGMDWDLYVTPALVILPFLVLVYAHIIPHLKFQSIAGPVLALCLMSGSFLAVNASRELLSTKLDHLGRWSFKTYWIGTSTILVVGSELAGSEKEQEAFRLKMLEDLEQYAIPGNDLEYAGLLLSEGKVQRKERQDNVKALEYFERAYSFSPVLGTNLYQLATTHFDAGNFADSYRYITQLADLKYQPYNRTLKMAIHVSLAAREYQSAANYAVTYLNRWQDDPAIAEVERRLRTGDRIETLVDLFGVK